jgi:small GTP-binding protein
MISKKIVLVGDFSTGKTSLIRRFVDNQFSDTYLSTIGVKISKKQIDLEDEILQALIWDIEGGTPEKPVNNTYLIGAHGCILVADATRDETLKNIANYIEIIQKVSPRSVFVLVLNKSDRLDYVEMNMVYQRAKEMYGQRIENIFVASAKTGENVENMFRSIASLVKR